VDRPEPFEATARRVAGDFDAIAEAKQVPLDARAPDAVRGKRF
jgi:hypothetical protein